MFIRQYVVLVLLSIVLVLFIGGCSSKPTKYSPRDSAPSEEAQMPMPRADPAYLQYLERHSMLAKSSEMAKVVSGSELAWKQGAGTSDGLLDHAENWLLVHPLTMLTSSRNTVFSQLASPTVQPIMRELGVKGLYVAPIQGSGAQWAKDTPPVNTGDDVVQYEFSRVAGTDDQYRRLMRGMIDNQGLMGSDLIPAATGLGPDFFLAARNVREYPGVYCMVEIPEDLWKHLPDVTSEWGGAALGSSQVAALNSQGLLPKAMRDEVSPLARMGGWAATGVVRGVDGNNYRWVYRYYTSPEYAVLNWEDPSQTAHRILSGSAVRQVGLQGQALLGLRFEAFQGLEAASERARNSFSVEPARTASVAMSREIRRYGGWSWVRDDDLPLNSVRDYLNSGVDFIFDSVFSPGAEHALLTGDASLARFMADEALRLSIDTKRLVHVMPAQDGINYSLPYLSYLAAGSGGERAASFKRGIQNAMRARASQMSPAPIQDNYLYTTAAGLAALALNAPDAASAQSQVAEIEKGHSLLIFFKAMQPGVMMLAGQDLSGVLPLDAASLSGTTAAKSVANASKGTYGLNSSANSLVVSNLGMPRAPQLYAAADAQVHQKDSFVRRIGAFLRLRGEQGVARGSLTARPETKGEGSIALLTKLAGGKGHLLSVCNFSRKAVTETITLSDVPGSALAKATPIATGGSHSVSGKTVTVKLGPWQGRALLFGTGAGGLQAVDPEPVDEDLTPIPTATSAQEADQATPARSEPAVSKESTPMPKSAKTENAVEAKPAASEAAPASAPAKAASGEAAPVEADTGKNSEAAEE